MRVLVFGSKKSHLATAAKVKALSLFASVKEVNWRYKLLPCGVRYTPLRIFYRTIECLYWSLRIFREICRLNIDIIITPFAYSDGLIGSIAGVLSKKPCVVGAGGSDLKLGSQSLLGKGMISWTLKNVAGVICVSEDLENIAKMFGAKNTIVIPCSIDFPDFDTNKIDFAGKDRVIISVAQLNPIKGMSYLIRAMKRIKDSRLVIIGNGPEKKKLESLTLDLELNNRVFFLGWIEHNPRFWDYLCKATVFVLPSMSEGLPRAMQEAMACGLPIVATTVGGIPEVITDGVNGFLVPPKDEKALAEAIEHVLNDVDFQKKASDENRNVAERWNNKTIGKKTYDYLKQIANNS